MGAQKAPPSARVPGEPLSQGGTDPVELGRAASDRHHGKLERAVERVEVEDVETTHYRSVQQEGADPVERAGRPYEVDHRAGPVGPIDPDDPRADRLHIVRRGKDHRRQRRAAVVPVERAVVDPDHPGVRLHERPTQR